MKSFLACLKKEYLEWLRLHKYIVIGALIIVFAILDPIMLKLLPSLIRSKDAAAMASLFSFDKNTAFSNYLKDLYQIATLAIVFISSGLICDDLRGNKLVIPYTKGLNLNSMVLSKVINAVSSTIVMLFLGLFINYYYISILFSKGKLTTYDIYNTWLLLSVYFLCAITLAIFFSSLFKKAITGAISTLLILYLLPLLDNFKFLKKISPYNLYTHANTLNFKDLGGAMLFAIGLSIVLVCITMINLKKKDIAFNEM